jgi:acetylglutamate kinase
MGARLPATVLKIGGELLERADWRAATLRRIADLAASGPLVVVHGGGREIDRVMTRRGLTPRAVDGLRITDAATLEIVVEVLAGRINTALVADLVAAGVRAVGLTGADAAIGLVEPAPAHRGADGSETSLGLVGRPVQGAGADLLADLCGAGYVPVVASIGASRDGRLFNVNADTLAAHLAASLGARRLLVAGATPGVLDGDGRVRPRLDADEVDALVTARTVTAGMIAKLQACREALACGVGEVAIVDGRSERTLAGTVVSAAPAVGGMR